MINIPSHAHPFPKEDSSFSQKMLVTEAKITSHVSIWMLWVTPLSLSGESCHWGLPQQPEGFLGPLTQACPSPCSIGGLCHTLGHHPLSGPSPSLPLPC